MRRAKTVLRTALSPSSNSIAPSERNVSEFMIKFESAEQPKTLRFVEQEEERRTNSTDVSL